MENVPIVENLSQEQAFKKLMESIPDEAPTLVKLPSKGIGYKRTKEMIKLRPMTFEDEKMLANSKTKGVDVLNLLISNCADGVDINELYSFDRLFLFLKLREISYGADYHSQLVCPDCKGENNIKISLDKIEIKEVPDTFSPLVEVKLKKAKNSSVLVKIPNTSLEQYTLDEQTVYDNLWRFVDKITVETQEITDKSLISKGLDLLSLMDKKIIIKALAVDYGIKTKVKFICSHCSNSKIIDLPLTNDFFTVN